MANQFQAVAYGQNQALINVFPFPVVAKRNPTVNDIGYQLGTIWINASANAAFVLSSVVSNAANWIDISGAGGVFSSLTVNPGPTNLSTVGNGAVTIGNATNTGLVEISVGTGNFTLRGNGNAISIGNDGAANVLTVGSTTAGALLTLQGGNSTGVGSSAIELATAAAGDIQIGLPTHTGAIYLGTSTAGETIDIATGAASANHINIGGTGANVIALGNTQTAGSITVGAAMTTGTITIGGTAQTGTITFGSSTGAQTVIIGAGSTAAKTIFIGNGTAGNIIQIGNGIVAGPQTISIANGASANDTLVTILGGNATAGTQMFNLLVGNRAGTCNIATGAAGHTTVIGSNTADNTVTIEADPTGASPQAISLSAGGYVEVAANPVTSASATPTVDGRVGVLTATGFTTAAAASQSWAITNDVVVAGSAVLVTVTTNGTQDAQMTVTRVQTAANLLTISATNNGTQAVNGNIILTYWILD